MALREWLRSGLTTKANLRFAILPTHAGTKESQLQVAGLQHGSCIKSIGKPYCKSSFRKVWLHACSSLCAIERAVKSHWFQKCFADPRNQQTRTIPSVVRAL